MGAVTSRCYRSKKNYAGPVQQLKARIRVLEEGIEQLRSAREQEARAYEDRKKALDAEREEEWRREREEETGRMRKQQQQQQRWSGGNEYLVEQMKEQQAQREVSVEKWKQLYLTIKTELDDLILRTRQGAHVFLGAEAGMVEGLRRELEAKEETIEALKSRISAMEKEGVKREREIDILRQSLRILSSAKRNGTRKNLQRRLRS